MRSADYGFDMLDSQLELGGVSPIGQDSSKGGSCTERAKARKIIG